MSCLGLGVKHLFGKLIYNFLAKIGEFHLPNVRIGARKLGPAGGVKAKSGPTGRPPQGGERSSCPGSKANKEAKDEFKATWVVPGFEAVIMVERN